MCWGAGAYPRKVHLVLCHLLLLNIRKMALNVREFDVRKVSKKSIDNFATNLFAGLIAYNLLPKKPEMNLEIIDKSRLIA